MLVVRVSVFCFVGGSDLQPQAAIPRRDVRKKAYSANIKRMSQFFGAHNYEAALYYITLSMQVCTLPFLKGYRLVIINCMSW